MTKISPAIFCAVLLGLALTAGQAQAQALSKTFVSKFGNDTGNCDFLTPCLTMARAVSQTAVNGSVNCIDSGDYTQTVTIAVSLTIDCNGTSASAGPFIINTPGITVVIKNLTIFKNAIPAIAFQQGAELHVEKVDMHNNPAGIFFNPPGSATLHVTDCTIHDNSPNGGILLQPTGSGMVHVSVTRVQLLSNSDGLREVGSGSTGQLRVSVRDSVAAGNANTGFSAVSTGTFTRMTLASSSASSNSIGILADGAQANLLLAGVTVAANNVGLSSVNGALSWSYTNNFINADIAIDGAPTGVLPPR